jgi:hypothetical protein
MKLTVKAHKGKIAYKDVPVGTIFKQAQMGRYYFIKRNLGDVILCGADGEWSSEIGSMAESCCSDEQVTPYEIESLTLKEI